MVFKCCICGTSYSSESAAVRCVNRCGRKAHKAGVFKTTSVYSEGTTKVTYESDAPIEETYDKCVAMLAEIQKVFPESVTSSFASQMSRWNELTDTQKFQLCDMIAMYVR